MLKFIRYITSRRKLYYLIAFGYLVITLFCLIAESYSKKNIIPKMSADVDGGWHVSSTIKLLPDPNIHISNGFDGNFDTAFHSSSLGTRGSLTIESPEEHVVKEFKISPQMSLTSRCPTNILLEASKNGKDWVTLGGFFNISYEGLEGGQFKSFDVASTDSYRFFRFDLKGQDEYLTFSELQLISQEYHLNYFYYFWLFCMSIAVVVVLDLFLIGNDK